MSRSGKSIYKLVNSIYFSTCEGHFIIGFIDRDAKSKVLSSGICRLWQKHRKKVIVAKSLWIARLKNWINSYHATTSPLYSSGGGFGILTAIDNAYPWQSSKPTPGAGLAVTGRCARIEISKCIGSFVSLFIALSNYVMRDATSVNAFVIWFAEAKSLCD